MAEDEIVTHAVQHARLFDRVTALEESNKSMSRNIWAIVVAVGTLVAQWLFENLRLGDHAATTGEAALSLVVWIVT